MANDLHRKCTILVTSDLHGSFSSASYRTQEEISSGLARLSVLIKQQRLEEPSLLLIDNGDIMQGSPLTYYAASLKPEDHNPAVAALNLLQYDAAVVGNHEFNYGQSYLRQAVEASDFPWLSAGIMDSATGEPAFGRPYFIRYCGDVKVAVLGVTTHYIPNWEHPDHIEGLVFEDALETVRAWVPRIREEAGPDLMVVAYHGGLERDPVTGEETETYTGENQGYAMCMEVEGIDMLITGHQHRELIADIGGVTVIQPGCNGQALGKLEIRFELVEGRWSIIEKNAELLHPDESLPRDPNLLKALEPWEKETQLWLDEKLGWVEGDLSIRDPFTLRTRDHPFIELVNRVQMLAAGVDISCTALLSEDTQGFGSLITMRDILTNFIYPNTLSVVELSGQDIRDALEKSASYFELRPDGSLGVSRCFTEPKAQHYNYDMWEGIEYEIDAAKPIGERVVNLRYQGTALCSEQVYAVVMNNYRATGGGEYVMFKNKRIVREITVPVSELMADYIREQGTIYAACDDNWRVSVPVKNL